MSVGPDDDHGFAHLLRLDGGDDSGGGSAIDDDVIGLRGGEAQGEEGKQGKAEEHGESKEVLAVGGWRLAVRK